MLSSPSNDLHGELGFKSEGREFKIARQNINGNNKLMQEIIRDLTVLASCPCCAGLVFWRG